MEETPITYDEVMKLLKYHHDKIKDSEYWNNFDPVFFDEVKKSFNEIISLIIAPSFRQYMEIYPTENIFVYGNKYYVLLSNFIHDSNYYLARGKYIDRSSEEFNKMIVYLQTFLSCIHMCIDNVEDPEIKEPGFDFTWGVRQYTENNQTGYYKVKIYRSKSSYDKLINYYAHKIDRETLPELKNIYIEKLNRIKNKTHIEYIPDF